MQPPSDVPALLQRYGLKPDKRLGQNFLIDPAALERVVAVAGVETCDSVLEVGPGLGNLTRLLAARARKVVAVELDDRLLPALQEVLRPFANTRLVIGDILSFDPGELMGEGEFLVVANIPYYITSALLRHLLETSLKPRRLTLTVQKEVAERITARPGDLSLLALSVQVYGKAQVAMCIPAEAFYPAPKVDSAVVRVELYPAPQIPEVWLEDFFRLAKAGFSQKRKTLRNALAGGLRQPTVEVEKLLRSASIDPMRRAESLSLEEWQRLVVSYREQASGN